MIAVKEWYHFPFECKNRRVQYSAKTTICTANSITVYAIATMIISKRKTLNEEIAGYGYIVTQYLVY